MPLECVADGHRSVGLDVALRYRQAVRLRAVFGRRLNPGPGDPPLDDPLFRRATPGPLMIPRSDTVASPEGPAAPCGRPRAPVRPGLSTELVRELRPQGVRKPRRLACDRAGVHTA